MNTIHSSLDELKRVARGEGTIEGSDRVFEHCASCEACGRQLAAMLMLTSTRLDDGTGLRARISIAATLALVAIAFFAAFVAMTESAPEPTDLSRLATNEPLSARVVQIHLGIASPAGNSDTTQRLQSAGVALAEGRFEEASQELEALLWENPSSDVVAAYFGIARYLAGIDADPTRALLETGSATENQSIASYSEWYLANHLLRRGFTEDAITVLSRLSARPTEPGRDALELLRRIRVALNSS